MQKKKMSKQDESLKALAFQISQRSKVKLCSWTPQIAGYQGNGRRPGEYFFWMKDRRKFKFNLLRPFTLFILQGGKKNPNAHSVTHIFITPAWPSPGLTDSLRHTRPPSRVKRTRSQHIWQLRPTQAAPALLTPALHRRRAWLPSQCLWNSYNGSGRSFQTSHWRQFE